MRDRWAASRLDLLRPRPVQPFVSTIPMIVSLRRDQGRLKLRVTAYHLADRLGCFAKNSRSRGSFGSAASDGRCPSASWTSQRTGDNTPHHGADRVPYSMDDVAQEPGGTSARASAGNPPLRKIGRLLYDLGPIAPLERGKQGYPGSWFAGKLIVLASGERA